MPRLATSADLEAITQTLVASFADYPWTRWTVPADRHRERVATIQRIYMAHVALPHGMVWVTDDCAAVAAFIPRGTQADDVPWDQLSHAHGDLVERLASAEQVLDPLRPEHDWVLAAVAVAPERQRQGLGTAVLRAGLERLDHHHHSCLVETSTPDNARLYRRLGWRDIALVPTPGPRVWIMHRPSTRYRGSADQPTRIVRTSRSEARRR
jgi:ribosomal protein S18 acetylase RimI-like enzyme